MSRREKRGVLFVLLCSNLLESKNVLFSGLILLPTKVNHVRVGQVEHVVPKVFSQTVDLLVLSRIVEERVCQHCAVIMAAA